MSVTVARRYDPAIKRVEALHAATIHGVVQPGEQLGDTVDPLPSTNRSHGLAEASC